MSNKHNIRRVSNKLVAKGTVNGLELFQNSEDELLYYKNNNGVIIPVINSSAVTEFVSLTDVPASYIGNGNKIVSVNSGETALEFTTFSNTWSVPGVAFVSTAGDDGTGTVGDGNLPYATITAAHAASSLVYILPGSYTEAVALKSGITYFSYPGVLFTAGGLTMAETCVGTKWLGEASFIGAFFPLLLLEDFTNFIFEFDEIDATSCAIRPSNSGNSTFIIKGRKMNHSATLGSAFSFGNQVSGTVTVEERVTAFYGVFSAETTYTFDGELIFNCDIECLNAGSGGNNASLKQCFLAYDSSATSKVIFNGDLYMNGIATLLASVTAAISVSASSEGTFIHNGNIYGGKQRSVLNTGTGKIILNGSSITENKIFETSAGELILNHATTVQEVANTITGTAFVWIEKCQMHSDAAGNIIDYTTGTGQLIVNDTNAEGIATGEFINTGGGAYATGLKNVYSNLANDGAMTNFYATAAVGFTQEANVTTPDFI